MTSLSTFVLDSGKVKYVLIVDPGSIARRGLTAMQTLAIVILMESGTGPKR